MKVFLATTIFVLVVLLTFIYLDPVEKQPEPVVNPFKQQLVQSIDTLFEEALRKEQLVGAAVALVSRDSIVYLGTYGSKKAGLLDSITPHTVFRIGSLSKGFASVLAGLLVEQQQLSWNTRVVQYVPDFQLKDPEQAAQITITHLLSHTTGLPYHTYTNLVEAGLPLSTIAGRLDEVNLVDHPGRLFSYQNAAYALSGELMSAVSKRPFRDLLSQQLFEPLGMEQASAAYQAIQQASDVAVPHRRTTAGWQPTEITEKYYNAIAAGGINASISDMAKWLQLLLGVRPDLIQETTLNQVFSPLVRTGDVNRYYQKWAGHEASYYGRGWRIHTFTDSTRLTVDTLIHHGGYVNGFRSEIALDRKNGLGICILTNNPNSFPDQAIPYGMQTFRVLADSIQQWQLKQRAALNATPAPER